MATETVNTKPPCNLIPGDRIETEYGPATVRATYPGHGSGPWGEWKIIVLPDGYAATRTIATGAYPGPIPVL